MAVFFFLSILVIFLAVCLHIVSGNGFEELDSVAPSNRIILNSFDKLNYFFNMDDVFLAESLAFLDSELPVLHDAVEFTARETIQSLKAGTTFSDLRVKSLLAKHLNFLLDLSRMISTLKSRSASPGFSIPQLRHQWIEATAHWIVVSSAASD